MEDIQNNVSDEQEAQNDIQSTRKKPESSFLNSAFDFIEILVFAIFAVLMVYTLFFRVCSVDGSSMNQTLQDKEKLIISDLFYTPKVGDVVIFHETGDMDEALVKRVIAVGGQTVKIDIQNGKTYVDGELIEDLYTVNSQLGDYVYLDRGYYVNTLFYSDGGKYLDSDGNYVREIPDGCIFVLGDNRNRSKDSRDPEVGLVDQRSVLGKVLLRLKPFGKIE